MDFQTENGVPIYQSLSKAFEANSLMFYAMIGNLISWGGQSYRVGLGASQPQKTHEVEGRAQGGFSPWFRGRRYLIFSCIGAKPVLRGASITPS